MHDPDRNAGACCEAKAAEGGGDRLVVTASETEEISEFAVLAAEAVGGTVALEGAHASDPALDAAMVLFGAVVQVGAGAVPDRPGVGPVAVRRYPVRPEAYGRAGRAEEGLGGLHVAVLAQHRIDQVPVPVDRPLKIDPPAADLQVRSRRHASLPRKHGASRTGACRAHCL